MRNRLGQTRKKHVLKDKSLCALFVWLIRRMEFPKRSPGNSERQQQPPRTCHGTSWPPPSILPPLPTPTPRPTRHRAWPGKRYQILVEANYYHDVFSCLRPCFLLAVPATSRSALDVVFFFDCLTEGGSGSVGRAQRRHGGNRRTLQDVVSDSSERGRKREA